LTVTWAAPASVALMRTTESHRDSSVSPASMRRFTTTRPSQTICTNVRSDTRISTFMGPASVAPASEGRNSVDPVAPRSPGPEGARAGGAGSGSRSGRGSGRWRGVGSVRATVPGDAAASLPFKGVAPGETVVRAPSVMCDGWDISGRSADDPSGGP
jgi:hypothetical protein